MSNIDLFISTITSRISLNNKRNNFFNEKQQATTGIYELLLFDVFKSVEKVFFVIRFIRNDQDSARSINKKQDDKNCIARDNTQQY